MKLILYCKPSLYINEIFFSTYLDFGTAPAYVLPKNHLVHFEIVTDPDVELLQIQIGPGFAIDFGVELPRSLIVLVIDFGAGNPTTLMIDFVIDFGAENPTILKIDFGIAIDFGADHSSALIVGKYVFCYVWLGVWTDEIITSMKTIIKKLQMTQVSEELTLNADVCHLHILHCTATWITKHTIRWVYGASFFAIAQWF